MPVSPVGMFSVLPHAIAALLSNCVSVQARIVPGDAVATLLRIPVIISLNPPTTVTEGEPEIVAVPRPRIIVCEPATMEFGRAAFVNNAEVPIVFEIDVPPELRKNDSSLEGPAPSDLIIDIRNWAGLVIKEAMDLSESGLGHPFIHGGRQTQRAWRSENTEEGDCMKFIVSLSCGLRGSGGSK